MPTEPGAAYYWGVDTSTHSFAIAAVTATGEHWHVLLEAEDPKANTSARLHSLFEQFSSVCAQFVWVLRPVLVGIEEANYTRNALVQRLMVRAATLAEAAAVGHHFPVAIVHNGTWKSLLGHHLNHRQGGSQRAAEKASVKELVMARFPDLPDDLPPDVYDSYGVAVAVLHGLPAKATKKKAKRPPKAKVA